MKTVHILNGDATLEKFNQTTLGGEVVVWREMLSEGPVELSIPDNFFELRANWFATAIKEPAQNYRQKVITEFEKLAPARQFDEVVLWFEFDLHCQVNLIFLLHYFAGLNFPAGKLSLICPSEHPAHPDFRGMGELTPAELEALVKTRLPLTEKSIAIGSEAWKVYCSGDKNQITRFLDQDFGQLSCLKNALIAHRDRLRDNAGALSSFENQLITLVQKAGANRFAIYKQFWEGSAIYGISDVALNLYLDKLIKENHITHLT